MGEEEGQGVLGEEEGAFAGKCVEERFVSYWWSFVSKNNNTGERCIDGTVHIHANFIPTRKLLGRELEKWLSRRPRTRVEDCCRNRRPAVDLFDLRKSALHALFATDVRGNPDGFAARRVDLVGEAVEVGGVSGQEDDGVGLCETACEGGACA